LVTVKVKIKNSIPTQNNDVIITPKYANERAFVTPTTSASTRVSATSAFILTLAKGLEIIVKVPEVDLKHIKLGQSVNIIANAYPKDIFQGAVKRIAP
jgi:HlyD family secretion protein